MKNKHNKVNFTEYYPDGSPRPSVEFRYRVWDRQRKVMEDVLGIDWYDDLSRVRAVRTAHAEIVEPNFVLLVYSGIKDANGITTYDGDLVRHKKSGDILLVQWTGFGWSLLGEVADTISLSSKDVKVIGNVYQNPEYMRECKK